MIEIEPGIYECHTTQDIQYLSSAERRMIDKALLCYVPLVNGHVWVRKSVLPYVGAIMDPREFMAHKQAARQAQAKREGRLARSPYPTIFAWLGGFWIGNIARLILVSMGVITHDRYWQVAWNLFTMLLVMGTIMTSLDWLINRIFRNKNTDL